MKTVTATSLKASLDAGEELLLLHVLPRASFDKKRLPGAQHASFYDDGFLERVEALGGDADARLVVYCGSASCNAAERAAAALTEAGWRTVEVLEGGIAAWEAAGLSTL